MRGWFALWILGCVAMITIGAVSTCQGIQDRARCEDNGGFWQSYDCHDVTYLMPVGDDGMMVPMTSEQCSHRCVGASAEANQ